MRASGWFLVVLTVAVMVVPSSAGVGKAEGPRGWTAAPEDAVALPFGINSHSDGGALAFALNQTLAVPAAGIPAASVPTSAIPITPPVLPPPTTPVVMTFLTASQTCCVSANYSAPTGIWGLIELKYTGQAVGGVYDSSFRAYIDQVQVLFGTTPEYGQWNVSQDVSRYVSLLNGTFNFTFLLSAALAGGYFLTSVSLWFYPVAPGTPPPTEPTIIVPLFHRVFVSTTTPTVTANATVPSNVVNATLELWTYGFNPDEFWYAAKPTFREFCVSVNGMGLAAVPPFPYINTGGNDLFAWRPITGVFTLNNPAYEVDVSGALGLIEGSHTYAANVTGVSPGSDWLIGAALVLYTDPLAGAAVSASASFSDPAPSSTSTSSELTETQAARWAFVSSWTDGAAAVTAASYGNTSFTSQVATTSSWSNLSVAEAMAVHSRWVVGTAVTADVRDTYRFSGGMDLGGSFVETSNTGGGYPIYGNFTTEFLNAQQDWAWTHAVSVATGPSFRNVTSNVENRVQGGTNLFGGTEELTGPSSALILAITFVESATLDVYRASSIGAAPPWSWEHLVGGSAYQPPAPTDAESVYLDEIISPLQAVLSATPASLDVNSTLQLRATATGGTPPYSYLYAGLPPGCSTVDAPTVTCTPSAPGGFLITVTAADALGDPAGTAVALVEVAPTLGGSLSWNRSLVESGELVTAVLTVDGGTAPYTCDWTVAGLPGQSAPCDGGFPVVAGSVGAEAIGVSIHDAAGSVVTVNSSLSVVAGPTLNLWPAPSGALVPGSTWTVVANVSGGVPPYVVAWYVNGVEDAVGPNLTFRSGYEQVGNYSITAAVSDAAGGAAGSAPLSLTVAAPPSQGGPGSGSSSTAGSSDQALLLGLALGATLGAAVGVGVVLTLRRRPVRPRRQS